MPVVFSQGRRASVPLYLLKAAGHLGGALHAAAARTGSSPAAAKKKQEAAWYLVQVHHNPLFLGTFRMPETCGKIFDVESSRSRWSIVHMSMAMSIVDEGCPGLTLKSGR